MIMLKNYERIDKKNDCPINNQPTYRFFNLNKFIDFLESIQIFHFFFTFKKELKL